MNRFCRSGMSMIEITFSVGILAMIMLPVFMTFSSGNRNMQMTESEFRAHTSAIELMEQIISLPFRLIPVGEFYSDKIADGMPFGPGPVAFKLTGNDGYEPEIKISEIKKDGKVVCKKITVKIRFPGLKNHDIPREFVLKSLVANENI